ncbi:MAG TPA: T9SS type A sorting domain-containing protein [Puia sp.]|nr:T9SS type A sorting domain-containing protein [Puia sp.]
MRNYIQIMLFVIAAHVPLIIFCQCTVAGPSDGNSFGNDATTGTLTWSNTANAKTSNNQYASVNIFLSALSSTNTKYLTAENFGFNIPATASICGIQVSVEHLASGIIGALGITLGSVSDNSVMIIKNGAISGSEHKSATPWTETNSTATYGSSSDTWGILNWLPADINAADFGVGISANLSALVGVALGANIDYINVTVSYLDPGILSLSLQDFIVSKKGNSDLISWTLQPQIVFSDFIIQRSNDQSNWQNIAELPAATQKTSYAYTDENPLNGINFYRLLLQNKNGAGEYSFIQSVSQQNEIEVSIFPNPASSYLQVHSKNPVHLIIINDVQGRTVKLFSPDYSTENISLNVSNLSPGLYLLQVDGSVYKFLKNQ